MARNLHFAATILLTGTLVALLTGCPPTPPDGNNRFTSADTNNGSRTDEGGGLPTAADGAEAEGEGSGGAEPREVVEPDVIRRIDNQLLVLNQYRGLTLVDLDAGTIETQVPTYGYPRDLYVSGDRAYVLVGYATDATIEDNLLHFDVQARLYVVDISNPAQAAIVSAFDLDGDLVDSRLVGDVLYAVCAQFQWYWADGTTGSGEVGAGGGVVPGDRAKVVKQQTSSSWVVSVNIADSENIHQVDEISFPGYSNIIQASDSGIFVAATDWDWWNGSGGTSITIVDISDPAGEMEVSGSVRVDGYVADRFKMDAYQGVLRVVSGGWWGGQNVTVTTIALDQVDGENDQEAVLGSYQLEGAAGESLFATRFDGNLAYIVTYFMVDPLFVLDLSDPANPSLAGSLTVPGWSTHIEPRGDRLIALGVDDTEGGRRVCVSLFDVSDPAQLSNPEFDGLIERVTFGENWSWSNAYSDVKSFTVLDDLLIVPFSGWSQEDGGYERLQFISWSPDGLDARGAVDLQGTVLRSLEYGGNYYAVTTEQLATIDATVLDAPEVTATLSLAQYVADYLEITPETDAEIIVQYDSADALVRTKGTDGAVLGQTNVAIANIVDTFVYGNALVIVGADWGLWSWETAVWSDTPHYDVAIVDCSDPAAPASSEIVRVELSPYWGWYWWGGYGPEVGIGMMDKRNTKQMGWWYPSGQVKNVFLVGDSLVLRGTAETYDSKIGDGQNTYQGFAIVDLANAALPQTTVGLAFDNVTALDQAGAKLYLSTQEVIDQTLFQEWWRPLCAYYVREITLAPLAAGPAANVPGAFVQYDAARDILTLRDYQWSTDGAATGSLRTVRWNGQDDVEELGTLALPNGGYGNALGRGNKIYLDGYDKGYQIYAAAIADDGTLTLSEAVPVTDQWGTILDAQGDSAYVTTGNVIARCDFSDTPPLLAEYTEIMGYPIKMRFASETAYAILGYFGIAELPL